MWYTKSQEQSSNSKFIKCILKQITHMGISIMLKSQGRAIDQNALHLPKPNYIISISHNRSSRITFQMYSTVETGLELFLVILIFFSSL